MQQRILGTTTRPTSPIWYTEGDFLLMRKSFAHLLRVLALQGSCSLILRISFLGRAVVATIHQPSSQVFNQLDKVLLLSGGEVVYFGAVDEMVPYFAGLGHKVWMTV